MITKRDESDAVSLVFQATATLSSEDYENLFIPELEAMLKAGHKIRTVLYLDQHFKGWDLGAMWEDASFGLKHRDDFDRIAVVGADKWLQWAMNIGAHFMAGQVKFFPAEELDGAIDWSKTV